jgi:transposase
MSLRLLQLVPSVPDDTARIARAAFPRGNPYVLLRNRLGPQGSRMMLGLAVD